ncbi:DUF7662 domain-containing protein [Parafrankia elaeagni]|uniref:DUF7662 domain-containing protein n=1 Tax=Parafrankia elaeagni TaxID=222534 RepID=UPI0003A73625|nr:hypothetical protein [Parafrankia elaeagni]
MSVGGTVGKYDGLRDHLAGLPAEVTVEALSFEAVEKLVGELPPSARQLRNWWANNSHTQAVAWRDAGWHVESVHPDAGRVVFARGTIGGTHAARKAAEAAAAGTAAAKAETVGEAKTEPVGEAEWPASAGTRAVAGTERQTIDAPPGVGTLDGGFSEASVQGMLVAHLVREGWEIRRVAETATKERGVDILAARDGRTLAVEVKGFPTRGTYADPARAGEVKPTQPGTQARHWYGQAILRAMLTHGEFPHYEVAIGLPDVPTYRRLHERTRVSLDRAAIGVLFVDEHGEVRS